MRVEGGGVILGRVLLLWWEPKRMRKGREDKGWLFFFYSYFEQEYASMMFEKMCAMCACNHSQHHGQHHSQHANESVDKCASNNPPALPSFFTIPLSFHNSVCPPCRCCRAACRAAARSLVFAAENPAKLVTLINMYIPANIMPTSMSTRQVVQKLTRFLL